MTRTNKFVRMVKRPEGAPTPDIFELDEEAVRPLEDGEFLIRALYLAIDPALVSRMRDENNYTPGVQPGEVMQGNLVGEVIESRNPDVQVGELRRGNMGMQEYAIQTDPSATLVVDPDICEPRLHLSVVGTTGLTALLSLEKIGQPKAGETVLISSGGSSVGTIAAQIAKAKGCRTVAIVSTPEKAKKMIADFGYDAATHYRGRTVEDLTEALREACPDGVDVYFDNTSGDISSAVIDVFNMYARHIVIGRMAISHLADTSKDIGRRDNNALLVKRIRKQGFVVFDEASNFPAATKQLAAWVADGSLIVKEDILDGIERAPEAFFRMMDGKSDGKQLVRIARTES